MKFENLLDEDGKPTKELDLWIAKHYADRSRERFEHINFNYDKLQMLDITDWRNNLPRYTTGLGTASLRKLVNKTFDKWIMIKEDEYTFKVPEYNIVIKDSSRRYIMAKALFEYKKRQDSFLYYLLSSFTQKVLGVPK